MNLRFINILLTTLIQKCPVTLSSHLQTGLYHKYPNISTFYHFLGLSSEPKILLQCFNWQNLWHLFNICPPEGFISSVTLILLPCMLSHFRYGWIFVIPWTLAHQGPLSMGFSRQKCWGGLPCPPPGDLLDPRIKPVSSALAGRFFTLCLLLSTNSCERRETKGKGEKERNTHLNAEFQRIAGRDKKALLNDQCKEQRKTIEWETLEISSRKLEIPREHFMQRWAK